MPRCSPWGSTLKGSLRVIQGCSLTRYKLPWLPRTEWFISIGLARGCNDATFVVLASFFGSSASSNSLHPRPPRFLDRCWYKPLCCWKPSSRSYSHQAWGKLAPDRSHSIQNRNGSVNHSFFLPFLSFLSSGLNMPVLDVSLFYPLLNHREKAGSKKVTSICFNIQPRLYSFRIFCTFCS